MSTVSLWSVPAAELDDDIDRRKLHKQADFDLARRTIHGVWAAAVCFLILVASSSYFKDHPNVVTAAGSSLAFILLFRVYVSRRLKLLAPSYSRWRTLYYTTLILSGCCWGVFYAVTVWFYGVDHGTTLLFLACMVTICSAVPVNLAPNMAIMCAFLGAAITPCLAIYCLVGGPRGWIMAAGATAFLAFCLIQGTNRNREYWNGIQAVALLKRRDEQLEQKVKERTSELVIAIRLLNEQKSDLAMLFEQAADCVLVTTYDAVLLDVNASGCVMTGYSREELVGRSAFTLLSPDDAALMRPVLKDVQNGNSVLQATRILTKDGRIVPIEFSAQMMSDQRLVAFVRDITRRKQAEEAARQAQDDVRDLSGHLLRLQDTERRHLARELHDTTAQNIFALSMKLELMMEDISDHRLRAALVESIALAEECLNEVRTFSYMLHPPMLDDLGLASALSWYVKGFVHRSGIEVQLETPSTLGRLPQDVETTLYRIVQESLTNIYRHSGSRTAAIRITPGFTNIEMEVRDKGHGILAEPMNGVGLASMRERVREIGGQFEILSKQEGTTVKVVLPLFRQTPA